MKDTMKERIYLIGQISPDKEITYRWRQEVKEFFNPSDPLNVNFEMIDPCDNEWNKNSASFNNERNEPNKVMNVYNSLGAGLIVPKDHSYVLRSTGCIANMNQYDLNKPIIGTLFELAWYYQNPEKCVIGVFSGDWTKDKHCNHPFVRETVDVWCEDHIVASKLLRDFYNRGVS
jgi:hypothetical protein